MASIWPRVRCASPKVTTCSTASKTFSHEVRNASAVSFHDKRRAQRAQKQHVRSGQRTLSLAPRHLLDDDRLAVAAIDAPHGVKQKNQKAPERNELEASFGKLIVPWSGLMAA